MRRKREIRGDRRQISFHFSDTAQGPQIDENINEGIVVGDGLFVTKLGAFDTQSERLGVDAFVGGALFIEQFVCLRIPVELVTDTGPDGGGHGGNATTF